MKKQLQMAIKNNSPKFFFFGGGGGVGGVCGEGEQALNFDNGFKKEINQK